MKQDMIVILDLGSEENPRLAREIRALGVYSEIYPHDITLAELNALPNVKGVILNGGPNHVVDGVEIDACSDIYGCGLPLLQPGHKGGAPWPTDAAQRKAVLSEFVFDACGAQPNWNMENFIADQVELIRRQVGDKKVLLALSGGVDSSVVAALLIKAIGKQLVCVHVNHGLLRKGEPEQVVEVFRDQMKANLVYVDAADRFLDKLAGVEEPEKKRKIIGAEFIRVFEEEARKLEGIEFLAQGTIYPDILESDGVKAHHNVGGLPEDMQFELVEPVKLLYKDEVRVVGKALGLPDSMVYRQPFPGPGLGVRCTGAITKDRLEAVREADAIAREEIEKLNPVPWQYFVAIPDLKSTGIKDGKRHMGWAAIIRAVDTVDAVTAKSVEIPFGVLCTIRDRIIAEVPGINRVLWDISDKPTSTIEWE